MRSARFRRRTSSGATRWRAARALDSHGKRAAFALFYAPLHFLVTRHVVRALDRDAATPSSVVDIGCGTGAAGAAWALAAGGVPVVGIDRHPWAVAETRWTYKQLGLSGQVRSGDVTRLPRLRPGSGVIAAYVLNELSEPVREQVEETLLAAAHRGVSVLVLEPIARTLTPWWDQRRAASRPPAAAPTNGASRLSCRRCCGSSTRLQA